MELVIKIPEELVYEGFERPFTEKEKDILIKSIGNGTPLPKGHGDLIDRDDLLADSYYIDDWSGDEINIVDVSTVYMADAIIEADNAESEETNADSN